MHQIPRDSVSLSPTLPPLGSAAPHELHSIPIQQPVVRCQPRSVFHFCPSDCCRYPSPFCTFTTHAINNSHDYSFEQKRRISYSIQPTNCNRLARSILCIDVSQAPNVISIAPIGRRGLFQATELRINLWWVSDCVSPSWLSCPNKASSICKTTRSYRRPRAHSHFRMPRSSNIFSSKWGVAFELRANVG